MKRNIIKFVLFFFVLLIVFQIIGILLMPNIANTKKYGLYKRGAYEILDEKTNTIDTIFLGDSLIYSSISPMYIWDKYGYTSFDCSLPAITVKDSYNYLKVAVDSQHPKVVMIESDTLFRDPKNKKRLKQEIKKTRNIFPFVKYHSNWKKVFQPKKNWLNYNKGYRYITEVKGISLEEYNKKNNKTQKIVELNLKYFDKIVNLCNENNIKLIIISNPTITWNKSKHEEIAKFSESKNLEFIDLNTKNINIDWEKETKDKGRHLNYLGARKVSSFWAEYLKKSSLVEDHRNDEYYNEWHEAYELYYLDHLDN